MMSFMFDTGTEMLNKVSALHLKDVVKPDVLVKNEQAGGRRIDCHRICMVTKDGVETGVEENTTIHAHDKSTANFRTRARRTSEVTLSNSHLDKPVKLSISEILEPDVTKSQGFGDDVFSRNGQGFLKINIESEERVVDVGELPPTELDDVVNLVRELSSGAGVDPRVKMAGPIQRVNVNGSVFTVLEGPGGRLKLGTKLKSSMKE